MAPSGFCEISPFELENAMKLIGKDWMLITTQDRERGRINAMTASWGCMGVIWNKPICVCLVRPQRYTFGLLEQSERFSVAFLGEEHRAALTLCGTKSGRDMDKIREAGLSTTEADGVPVLREARILLICRKIYADDLKEAGMLDPALLSHYANGDLHRVYVCEIEHAYIRA